MSMLRASNRCGSVFGTSRSGVVSLGSVPTSRFGHHPIKQSTHQFGMITKERPEQADGHTAARVTEEMSAGVETLQEHTCPD